MAGLEDILSEIAENEEIGSKESAQNIEKEEAKTTSTQQTAPISDEEKELTNLFGPVDEELFKVGQVPLKRVEFGQVKDYDDDNNPIPGSEHEDKNTLILFFDVQESFADEYVEKHVAIRRGDDEEKQEKTNKLIAHAFKKYGSINSFDVLTKLVNPVVFTKLVDGLKSKGVDLTMPIYRGSFTQTGNDGDDDRVVVYYRLINRRKSFGSTYSEWYQENGGFPAMPDKHLAMEGMTSDASDGSFEARILSVNNNVNFKRFEIEFEVVNPTPQLEAGMKSNDIHSYLATYKYSKGNGDDIEIDSDKRSRQAQKISSKLGVLDFANWPSKIGSVVRVKVNTYDSKFSGYKGKVYRAVLA